MILGKNEKEMDMMFTRAKKVMKALLSLIPKEEINRKVKKVC